MAETQCSRAAKGMPEHSETMHVQPSRKPAGWIGCVKTFQLIGNKLRVSAPHGQDRVDKTLLSAGGSQVIGIRCRRPQSHASIREHDNRTAVRSIETHHYI